MPTSHGQLRHAGREADERQPPEHGYPNRDRVGTPENFKQYLIAGARSHGHNAVGWRSRTATTNQCGVGTWTTYTQSGWGSNPNNDNNAAARCSPPNFASVYPGGVTIGNTAPGKFKLTFTTSAAIKAFLPAGGKVGVLQATATNPIQLEGAAGSRARCSRCS